MTEDELRSALLKQRKLFGTTTEMAREMGVSRSHLYRFLSGDKGIGLSKVMGAMGLQLTFVPTVKPAIDLGPEKGQPLGFNKRRWLK